MSYSKVVVCGAGFVGTSIIRHIANAPPLGMVTRRVQISSRNPQRLHEKLRKELPQDRLLPAVPLDITKPETLAPAFEGADVVVSLVGTMYGTPQKFEEIQWRGAENVAKAAKQTHAKLIHFSAIGANSKSEIPYVRTKGLAEESVVQLCPNVTILRPSLVFGPHDNFFNRFAQLSRLLPFLPVYGGGTARFQPVYVEDLGRAVEIISRLEPAMEDRVAGVVIEAGGPDILTFRELMELILKYTHRNRPIVSVPFALGYLQGTLLEKLPTNLFTVTRAQVDQLRRDNIVTEKDGPKHYSFKKLVEGGRSRVTLGSVFEVLPTYLG